MKPKLFTSHFLKRPRPPHWPMEKVSIYLYPCHYYTKTVNLCFTFFQQGSTAVETVLSGAIGERNAHSSVLYTPSSLNFVRTAVIFGSSRCMSEVWASPDLNWDRNFGSSRLRLNAESGAWDIFIKICWLCGMFAFSIYWSPRAFTVIIDPLILRRQLHWLTIKSNSAFFRTCLRPFLYAASYRHQIRTIILTSMWTWRSIPNYAT